MDRCCPSAAWDAAFILRNRNVFDWIDTELRGWEQFVRRLCEIDCVQRLRYDEAASGGPAVKVLDDNGTIAVRFGSADLALSLVLTTTARDPAELVAAYLRDHLR